MTRSALLVNVLVRTDLIEQSGWNPANPPDFPPERAKFAEPLHNQLFGEKHRRVKIVPRENVVLCDAFHLTGLELLLAGDEASDVSGKLPGVLIALVSRLSSITDADLPETLAETVRKNKREDLVSQILAAAASPQRADTSPICPDVYAPNVPVYPVMFLGCSPGPLSDEQHLLIREIATTTPRSEHGKTRDMSKRIERAINEQYRIHDTLLGVVATWGAAFIAIGNDADDDPADMIAYQYTELAAYLRLEAAILLRTSSVFTKIATEFDDTQHLPIRRISLLISENLRRLLVGEMRYRSAVAAQPLVFRKFIAELEEQFQVARHRLTLQTDAESITEVVRLVEDGREAGYRKQVSTLATIFGAIVAILSLTQVPPAVGQMAGDIWGASESLKSTIQLWTLLGMGVALLLLSIWRFLGILRQKGRF